MLSSFTVRCTLYPLTLIKTQLQIQRHNDAYTGVLDAAAKIYRAEGVPGLYRGFWVSTFQIVSGVFYISAYEGVRHQLAKYDFSPRGRALIAGGVASLVGQTIIVPFDVLSQHLMVLGMLKAKQNPTADHFHRLNPLGLSLDPRVSRAALARQVALRVHRMHGLRGFYKGYGASLAIYVPNSALWWALYQVYQDELMKIAPEWISILMIQCTAGVLGGFTTTLLTNPLDIVRARLQVQGEGTIRQTAVQLFREEGLHGMFMKSLTARLVQSACFSFTIILGYETIKRLSLNEEYKRRVRW